MHNLFISLSDWVYVISKQLADSEQLRWADYLILWLPQSLLRKSLYFKGNYLNHSNCVNSYTQHLPLRQSQKDHSVPSLPFTTIKLI